MGVQPGIVGICEVAREAYPDPTAADEAHKGYDPKGAAGPDGEPRWSAVDVRMVQPYFAAVYRSDPSLCPQCQPSSSRTQVRLAKF